MLHRRFRVGSFGVLLSLIGVGSVFGQAKVVAGSAAPRSAVVSGSKPAAVPAKTADDVRLDLNVATADQLKVLPGVGEVYAKRIIGGRPYTMKNQLVQRGILPPATYDKIKDSIVAHRVVK